MTVPKMKVETLIVNEAARGLSDPISPTLQRYFRADDAWINGLWLGWRKGEFVYNSRNNAQITWYMGLPPSERPGGFSFQVVYNPGY